ncbi:C2 domain protein [Teladorsagia circumcincta]|uniref:C2 domain protein n=1 Tax=Teladorsagia circumcincta TaxID=45464 RepID=A0A2G9UMC2_TELCI|nr:C2 domain protein [Teladorsagia circumcincta]
MTVCWDRIDVSELTLRIDYTKDLVDILCDIVITYTKKIFSNLDAEGFSGELQVFVPSPLLQLLCSAINNCEQVRRSLMIHEKLHLDDLAITYERAGHGAPTWKTAVEQRLEQTDATICAEIDRVVGLLTSRLKPQMKKHVFHLAWSPTAHPVEDSLKPLTDMIDIELSAVHKNLLHKNFLRVMSAQVGIVVHLLKECVDENPGELVKLLSLNQTPTQQLIEKYYKDLLKQQNEVSECKYGILNVRAYYNANSQTLVLDVIGAKQVIPLDANGLSDPFVVIRLVPKYRYPTQVVSKTRVVSKTLNPIFDETFELKSVSPCPFRNAIFFLQTRSPSRNTKYDSEEYHSGRTSASKSAPANMKHPSSARELQWSFLPTLNA